MSSIQMMLVVGTTTTKTYKNSTTSYLLYNCENFED
jgi:hypothetical protein